MLLRRAFALVTTSVAEGFGLSFLEPWIAKRPLTGRDLPEITEQLKSHGMDMSGLYTRLDIPASWIDGNVLRHKVASRLRKHFQAYRRAITPEDVHTALSEISRSRMIDFGRLDENLQEQVITKILESPSTREELQPSTLGPHGDQTEPITRNRIAALRDFGLASYGKRLTSIYREIAASPSGPVTGISTETLLDCFLDPKRFSLLRTDP